MFSAKHLKTGKLGEDIASQHLKKLGYAILARNYKRPWGEIDLISQARDKTLVFVEVKTLNSIRLDKSNGLSPEDNLTTSKLEKLKRVCQKFANSHPELVDEKKGWQIDLIAITLNDLSLLTNSSKNCIVKHYPNVT